MVLKPVTNKVSEEKELQYEACRKLQVVLKFAIRNGYRLDKYWSEELMLKWLDRKIRHWKNIRNPFIKNKYYYGLIFDMDFIIAIEKGRVLIDRLKWLEHEPLESIYKLIKEKI